MTPQQGIRFSGARSSFIAEALKALAIGYVTFKAVDTFVIYAKGHFLSSLVGAHPLTMQLLGVCQVGTAVNMLASAYVTRLVIKGMSGGTLKSMKFK